jgi:hypothetical protein
MNGLRMVWLVKGSSDIFFFKILLIFLIEASQIKSFVFSNI